jgi:uncharacterized protein (TIGR03437 family)
MGFVTKCPTWRLLAGLLVLAAAASGQNVVATYAGTDWQFPADGKRALEAPLGGARGLYVAVDGKGSYYIGDPDNRVVMKVTPDGTLRVVAGNGIVGDASGDGGFATDASIATLSGIAVDGNGVLYLAEYSQVRKVDEQGVISTVAGAIETGFADGSAASARFNYLAAIAADKAGNLFVADWKNHRIRKIAVDGTVSTLAGDGKLNPRRDGKATAVSINEPYALTVDPFGDVIFTDADPDTGLGVLRAVTPDGNLVTLLFDSYANGFLVGPIAVAADAKGDIYFSSYFLSSVYKITVAANFAISAVAGLSLGDAGKGFSGDGGPATKAKLNITTGGLAADADGSLLIADNDNTRIRRVTPDGIINTVAGNGQFRASSGLPATSTALYLPFSIAFDGAGNLYTAEAFLNRIRKIGPNGLATSFAGTGESGFSGDNGPAGQAVLSWPFGVAADRSGNVYIADTFNSRVRRVSPDGQIVTIAGGGTATQTSIGDGGPATQAALDGPQGVAVDAAGNVYISEYNGHRIRKVSTSGTITTIAGTSVEGYTGDNGPAIRARISYPVGIKVDAAGNVYVAENGNNVIRKISSSGTISTYAGNGNDDYTGDNGPATRAALSGPYGIALDQAGNLYIADSGNYVIRQVDTYGVIRTVAGSGYAGFGGDGGPASDARFSAPRDVAIDGSGNLFVADSFNDRVRVVLVTLPQFQTSPKNLGYTVVEGGDETPTKNLYISGSVPGLPFRVEGNRRWMNFSPSSGVTPATIQVSVTPPKPGDDTSAGTITVSAPSTSTGTQTASVALALGPPPVGGVDAATATLSFSSFQGTAAPAQPLDILNTSATAADFSLAPDAGSAWIKATPAGGNIPARGRTTVQVSVDASLAVGTYTGQLLLTDLRDGTTDVVTVTATVSPATQSISLTQTGLTFTAVANAGASAPQTAGIVNLGRGVMNWTAAASSLAGAPVEWFTVSPSSGSSDAASRAVPEITVSVNPAGLAAGNYYGQVRVAAPGADNSPQFLLVVLTVLPAGTNPGPVVQPTSLIFNAAAGGGSPGSQTVTVSNLYTQPVSFTSGRATQTGKEWFVHIPASGTIAPGASTRFVVQPYVTGLEPGVYRGSLTLLFDGNVTRTVNLVFIVSGAGVTTRKRGQPDAGGCGPSKLVPVFTSLGNENLVPAGWPQRLVVRVFDDCGTPMASGAVTAQFSGNIAPVHLSSLKDGNWSGTWQSRNEKSATITIKIKAEAPEQQLAGAAEIESTLSPNPDPPVLDNGAVLNAASRASDRPLSPGSLISITGTKLAQAATSSAGLPLSTSLAGTLVALGGQAIPLVEVADDHIAAVLPYDVPVNTRLQLIVQRGNSAAVPESITIAPAQPAVFTQDKTGRGQGLVFKVNADKTTTLADPAAPAAAGDTIQIQCTGLGAVNPPVPAGTAAPDSPLASVTAPVGVTIGGVKAEVSVSVLQPGATGIYIVQATVPSGVTPGDAVPVIVTAGTQSSGPVTMAVK